MIEFSEDEKNNQAPPFEFDYLNHKGRERRCRIDGSTVRMWVGVTEYYPFPTALMTAYDYDKNAIRTFAINKVLRYIIS
jgi:hypothetical protein